MAEGDGSGGRSLWSAEQMRADSRFFDRLVEMIPPRYYIPRDNDTATTPIRFLKGASAKAEAKKAAKERSKKAKRAKLNPTTAKTTVQLQEEMKRREEEGGDEDEDEEEGEHEEKAVGRPIPKTERAKNIDELRQKLQQRLQELRARRKADTAESAKDWREKQQQQQKKTKGKPEGGASQGMKRKREERLGAGTSAVTAQGQKSGRGPTVEGKIQRGAQSSEPLQFEFGRVRLGTTPAGGHTGGEVLGKKKKGGKTKDTTQSLLAKAVALQRKLEADEDSAKKTATAWGAAASRAAGQKVLDDPKLLQKRLKREERERKKSAKEWAERKQSAAASSAERQRKRDTNIQRRKDKKLATKIAKREKKLMRPGFEGRAGAAPINRSPAAASGSST